MEGIFKYTAEKHPKSLHKVVRRIFLHCQTCGEEAVRRVGNSLFELCSGASSADVARTAHQIVGLCLLVVSRPQ